MIHALLVWSLKSSGAELPSAWAESMERMAAASRDAYSQLIGSPGFLEFFRQATPFPELANLNSASRPVSRTAPDASETVNWEDLRAIPWVFSWTQNRANLPGWFGLGTALNAEMQAGRLAELRAMYRDWPFFATALDNAQISLGTADMQTARRYAALAQDTAIFETISTEYQRAVSMVVLVTQQQGLLAISPVLARSIKLRNPYVDALHLSQFALLERYREVSPIAATGDRETLLDAIHHSINGIAAGLQTTG